MTQIVSDEAAGRRPSMIPIGLFLAFAFGYFLTHLFRVVNAVVGPAISSEVGIDVAGLGFLTSAYFLAFAATQLPLGILLDRYAANRVQAVFLVATAVGAVIFAFGDSIVMLTIGRALIGLGVSSGLMSAFKAYSVVLPPERLPLVNSLHMAAGSLGVLAGGLPVELAMDALGWRNIFLCLAALSLVAAFVLFFAVKQLTARGGSDSFSALIAGVGQVVVSPSFIRIAPLSVATQATGLALIALWIGPWLRDVAGYAPSAAATIVSSVGIAMIAGYVMCGVVTNQLVKRGIPLSSVMIGGYLCFFSTLPVVMVIEPEWAVPVWIAFALFVSFGTLSYPVLGLEFPRSLTGRVHTALNFLVFAAAFALQWAVGIVVEALAPSLGVNGAYDVAFSGLVALQAAGYIWYFLRRPEQVAA
jgi:predicted MFS family arabinose efflux permease